MGQQEQRESSSVPIPRLSFCAWETTVFATCKEPAGRWPNRHPTNPRVEGSRGMPQASGGGREGASGRPVTARRCRGEEHLCLAGVGIHITALISNPRAKSKGPRYPQDMSVSLVWRRADHTPSCHALPTLAFTALRGAVDYKM